MLRAVVFDLDGTLIDSTDAIVNSVNHLFDFMGNPRPERQTVVDGIGMTLEDGLTALLGVEDPAPYVPVYRAHYAEHACDCTVLMPGVRETLEAFQTAGLRIGFATSKKRNASEMLLEHLSVLSFFESRIGPDEVTHPKPHPEAVQASFKALGLQPDEIIFVGDMDFDVKAAQRAGVRCLAVATGYLTRAELEALSPEAVYDDMWGVRDHILTEISREPSKA